MNEIDWQAYKADVAKAAADNVPPSDRQRRTGVKPQPSRCRGCGGDSRNDC